MERQLITTKKDIKNKTHRLFYLVLVLIIILTGILIFRYYLLNIQEHFLCKFGYTICTYPGQDFFSLYQSAYNLFHNIYIYGQPAQQYVVTPFFMEASYFPASPLIWGSFFILIKSFGIAYYGYLFLSILLHLFSIALIYLIAKKAKTPPLLFSAVVFFWLSYFSLNSEWNIGQFNHLAGIFFLAVIAAVIYNKKLYTAVLWILSLSWKPIAILILPFFVKTKNKTAMWSFFVVFIIFTVGYVLYYLSSYPRAWTEFYRSFLNFDDPLYVQIHYRDNFSVISLIAEIFYDKSQLLWKLNHYAYLAIIAGLYLFVSIKIKLNNLQSKVYYLLFCVVSILVFHKEIWESWLTCWLPIICVLLLLAKSLKEKIYIIICGILLATPTLFYFWQHDQTPFWRFWLIAEKAIPQLLLYIYILFKIWPMIDRNKYTKISTKK